MKTYKIITLGASGAGKTVFLASMFKALSIQGDYTFFLEVEDQARRKRLNAIYTQVITADNWPEGTKYGDVSEWTFNCRVKVPTLDTYTACQFTYFDYAGGRLIDSEEDAEFTNIVQESSTILGLLDGKKIYSLMKDSNDLAVNIFLNKDLPNILKWMNTSRVPIHFVISKWDLIENEFSLRQVRERLLKIPAFEELIHIRNHANSPVRLIPVSSIGSGFAIPQPDGSMKKISGAIPDPFQVEVPLACVLPDGLQARLSEVKEKQQEIEKTSKSKPNIFSNVLVFVGKAAQISINVASWAFIPPEFQVEKALLHKLSESIGLGLEGRRKASIEREEKLNQERNASLKLVKDEETALMHAVDNFAVIQNKFERVFPDSELILM
ncbi:hypothetical protein VB711_15615 [Cronbergia sp. UHCC 0137]|uniref:hypothetical protein n=1 Tax=Cronbergia sp. UHCC 0137 TaxID=3110239 RepID=UPI002B21C2EA|nr:hypothetical protein [Cronbergia sp. UHCC 0137]MEA5619255.1 hypothetical protein [Cronbergia sp. UHCC 0137]